MNELDNGAGANRQGGWLRAIGIGVVVCVLVAAIMSAALRFFLPEIVDDRSILSDLCGIGVWLISIGLGIWQLVRHRPKNKSV